MSLIHNSNTKYIVALGISLNTFNNSLLFVVALNDKSKSTSTRTGIYNFKELEDNHTPNVNTRFNLKDAKEIKNNYKVNTAFRSITPSIIPVNKDKNGVTLNKGLSKYYKKELKRVLKK